MDKLFVCYLLFCCVFVGIIDIDIANAPANEYNTVYENSRVNEDAILLNDTIIINGTIIHKDYSFYSEDIFNKTLTENQYVRGYETIDIIDVKDRDCRQGTFIEIFNFLLDDYSSCHEYILNEYDCTQFSEKLVNNALRAGYEANFVYVVTSNNSAHAIVAFNTSDKGWIFVDNTAPTDLEGENVDFFVEIEHWELIKCENIRSNGFMVYRNLGEIEYVVKVE